MKYFLLIILWSIAGVFSHFSIAEPWTHYYGSHYEKAPWADSVRDPIKPRYLAAPLAEKELSVMEGMSRDKHIIYGVDGLGSGRNMAHVHFFLNRMLLDYGEAWKQEIAHNALTIFEQQEAIPNQVVWQFGNEINSRRFNETVFDWAGGGRVKEHNTDVIPYYVEYYLAPGVEALRQAQQRYQRQIQKNAKSSQTPFTGSDKIRVALGSIAVAAHPGAQKFMDALLSYQVKGLCAPSLKGVQVTELVDIVTMHYIVSANRPVWREALDSIKSKWYQKGRIEAFWSTEEIGIERAEANVGGVFAVQVLARYMDWWLAQGFSADQGRAFFWGTSDGDRGHRGKEALQQIYDLLGPEAELRPLPPKTMAIAGNNIEYYGFSIAGTAQKVVFIFPKNQRQDAKLTQWQWAADVQDVQIVQTRIFSDKPQVSFSPNIQQGELAQAVTLPKSSIWVGLIQ